MRTQPKGRTLCTVNYPGACGNKAGRISFALGYGSSTFSDDLGELDLSDLAVEITAFKFP